MRTSLHTRQNQKHSLNRRHRARTKERGARALRIIQIMGIEKQIEKTEINTTNEE